MANQPFNFKQFKVEQDKCAMKIGTDAVLLGAWSSLKNKPFSVLYIGSGTGVLSLMLAQRCNSEIIDALEIDANAYEQCVENFESSLIKLQEAQKIMGKNSVFVRNELNIFIEELQKATKEVPGFKEALEKLQVELLRNPEAVDKVIGSIKLLVLTR